MVKPALQDASVGIDQGSVVRIKRSSQRGCTVTRDVRPANPGRGVSSGREFHVNVIEDGPDHATVTVLPFAEIAYRDAARTGGRFTPTPPNGMSKAGVQGLPPPRAG